MGYVVYLVRVLFRGLGALIRRRPGEYVSFILEEAYPVLPPPKERGIRRLLSQKQVSLRDIGERFDRIAADPRVKGVVLHIRPTPTPLAHIEILRSMVGKLRSAGKRVVAWSHSYDTSGYYLASACDEILCQEMGGIGVLGIRRGFAFLKDALSRVGLEGDFVQISPYKSAADPITKNRMSDEVREMSEWLADSTYDEFITAVAQGRGLEEDVVRGLVDRSPYWDADAVKNGLVDALTTEEGLPAHLAASGDGRARIDTWDRARKRVRPKRLRPPSKYVALLRIEGDIIDGRSKRPPFKGPAIPFLFSERVGDLTVVDQVRKVIGDKRAAAAVLFVESGGGSATSSEAMAAELRRLAADKPLVVSMGWVAGSGGYWVSTPGAWIVAEPTTLTGSIGVLNGKIVNAGLFQRLLINREVIARGEASTMNDGRRPFTPEERQKVWDFIVHVYDLFLDRVTASRNKTREEVDAVAAGRVWTGAQALRHGLIDELGDVDVAIAKARELAGLPDWAPVREVRPQKQPLAPQPAAAAALDHALEGIRMFNGPPALALMPFVEDR